MHGPVSDQSTHGELESSASPKVPLRTIEKLPCVRSSYMPSIFAIIINFPQPDHMKSTLEFSWIKDSLHEQKNMLSETCKT